MSTVNHTGHPINVANFQKLIAFLVAMGAIYDPVNSRILIPALNVILVLANGQLQLVKDTSSTFDIATNNREVEFKNVKKLATRLVNALIACGASKQTIADAKTINRKIQGGRAVDKIVPPVPPTDVPLDANSKIIKNISVSQQNFDFVLDNMLKLLTLLTNEPLYIPNEVDLQAASILIKVTSMQTTNKAVIDATPDYINAMASRDVVLYKEDVGLVDTAKVVKAYCLSVLETANPVYKNIKKLAFRTLN
jgi:hypothetical protein